MGSREASTHNQRQLRGRSSFDENPDPEPEGRHRRAEIGYELTDPNDAEDAGAGGFEEISHDIISL
jgi:hypothetical protein